MNAHEFFSDPASLTFTTNGEQLIPSFGCTVDELFGVVEAAFVTVN